MTRDAEKITAGPENGEKVHAETAKRGLWSRVKEDIFCLAPPLTTSKDEVDRIIQILDESISAVFDG